MIDDVVAQAFRLKGVRGERLACKVCADSETVNSVKVKSHDFSYPSSHAQTYLRSSHDIGSESLSRVKL